MANLEESVSENGPLITDYQFEQNTYSDSQFLQDNLRQKEPQKESTILITDGAYCGSENTALAASKNIQLITTDLTGTLVMLQSSALPESLSLYSSLLSYDLTF